MDEQNSPQPSPAIGNVPPAEPKGSVGPLIGSIIIIIVLIVGAIYFWGDTLNKKAANEGQTASTTINILENGSAASTSSNGAQPDGFAPEGPAAN